MTESGREACRYAGEWSKGYPEFPGVVGMPYQMYGSGWETLLDVWQWSEGLPGCPGLVGWPSRMSGSGR